MKKQHFSLVELMLALGVVAIGVCSIMVLFPIGANASRDASMETFIAQAADQLLNFQKYNLYSSWDLTTIPSSKTNEGNTGGIVFTTTKANWNRNTMLPNLFTYTDPTKGLYQLVSYKNVYDVNDAEHPLYIDNSDIDYRVIMKIYYNPIVVGSSTYSTDIAVRLNVEASWPAEIPDGQRQKVLYTLDVFKLH